MATGDTSAGELREYVVEELNVSELATAAPDDFSTTTAMPNFDVLGKRLGKDMRAVGAAIKAMTPADISTFQETGSATFEGHTLSGNDVRSPVPDAYRISMCARSCFGGCVCIRSMRVCVVQIIVKRESKPLGEEMDINTDGEVLVVLDLRADSALLTRRTARELVNRFQKLRKKAGLEPGDVVELFYSPKAAEEGGADGGAAAAALADAIAAEEEYLKESLGGVVLPAAARPAGAVVLEREATAVQLPSDERVEVDVEVAPPTAAVAAAAVEADYGAAAVAAVEAFVASKDLARLRGEAEGGSVVVRLDGRDVRLEVGKHLFWSAARR